MELIPKPILFLIIRIFQIIFMVRNLIFHSKYEFKEALFEFWDRLEKNEQKLQWEFAPEE